MFGPCTSINCVSAFLFMFFLIVTGVHAQSGDSYQEPRRIEISINRQDELLKVHVLTRTPVSFKTRDDLTYGWQKSDEIHHTQGGFEGRLLDGPYVSFYTHYQLREKGVYRKGLRHGKWLSWRPDGTLESSREWDRGRICGENRMYDTNGELAEIRKYRNGKLHGSSISYRSDTLARQHYRHGNLKPDNPEKEAASRTVSKGFDSLLRSLLQPEKKDPNNAEKKSAKKNIQKHPKRAEDVTEIDQHLEPRRSHTKKSRDG